MNRNDIISLGGAAVTAVAVGKYAHAHGKPKLAVAGYALGAAAIGAGVTKLIILKTGESNSGWEDLVVPIYILAGVGTITLTAVISWIAKK